jgi:YVTN family beta-propeller protein
MISPDGRWAVVTNRLSGNITIIDTATRLPVAIVATGTNPEGLAFSADGTKTYITNARVDLRPRSNKLHRDSNNPERHLWDVRRGVNDGHECGGRWARIRRLEYPSGICHARNVETNSAKAVFPVGARPLGIAIRMWP